MAGGRSSPPPTHTPGSCSGSAAPSLLRCCKAHVQPMGSGYPKYFGCLGHGVGLLLAASRSRGAEARSWPLWDPSPGATAPSLPQFPHLRAGGVQGKEGKEGDVPPAPNALTTSSEATDGAFRLNSSLEIHPETKSSAPSPAKPLPPALTDTFASPRAKNPGRTASGPAQHLPQELLGSLSPQDRERGVPKTPPRVLPAVTATYLCWAWKNLMRLCRKSGPCFI